MILHKLLRGARAGTYLPFALSRLKALEAIQGEDATFQQKYMVDGYRIEVEQSPPFQYVRIVESGPFFEFYTSGFPIVKSSAVGVETYKAAVVSVSLAGKTPRATLRGGRREEDASKLSQIGRPAQIQLADEPVAYPAKTGAKTYPTALFESFAPVNPYTGVFLRCYNQEGGAPFYRNRGTQLAHAERDFLFDVPFQLSRAGGRIKNAFVRGDADWPRACGLCTVEDEFFGSRTFAVYIDAFSQFWVFPTSEIGPPAETLWGQNVDQKFIQTRTATLPSWAYKPTQTLASWYDQHPGMTEESFVHYPELDWKLHPDGTRACAVVLERREANRDAAYLDDNPGAAPMDDFAFSFQRDQAGVAARNLGLYHIEELPQRYNVAPGLVEARLAITLTGPAPEDFTFELTTVELRRPTTTPLCTLLAGYVWQDVKSDDYTDANQHYAARRGDLISLDIERYWRDDQTKSFFSVKNLSQEGQPEIRDWAAAHVIDYDFPTLSFVFGFETTETVTRSLAARPNVPGGGAQDTDFTVVHPAVCVTTFNQVREVLTPETMLPAVRDGLVALASSHPRLLLEGFSFMPLNDLRDWTDPTLATLRDYLSQEIYLYKTGLTTTPPGSDLENWWDHAMKAYLEVTPLLWTDAPCFGWYVYADEIMNRLWTTARSTFFVHPTGAWAYFDQQHIYNKFGVCGPQGKYDSLTPFLVDAAPLEHVIYDRVHFVARDGSAIDTTFIDLYNQAIQNLPDSEEPAHVFHPLSKNVVRATLTRQSEDIPGPFDGLFPNERPAMMRLRIDWQGWTGWLYEPGYQGGKWDTHGDPSGLGLQQCGVLCDFTLAGGVNLMEGASSGVLGSPYNNTLPVTFSSCALING